MRPWFRSGWIWTWMRLRGTTGVRCAPCCPKPGLCELMQKGISAWFARPRAPSSVHMALRTGKIWASVPGRAPATFACRGIPRLLGLIQFDSEVP